MLAIAHADSGQFDDAWRCIGEAMTAMQATKERWCEAEAHRVAGEIALKSPQRDVAKAQAYFEHSLSRCASTAGKVVGIARGHEPGAALERSGKTADGT